MNWFYRCFWLTHYNISYFSNVLCSHYKFCLFQQESDKDKQLQGAGEQQRSQLVTVTEKRREKEEAMQLAREEMERLKQCLDSLQLDVNKLTVKLSQVWQLTSIQLLYKQPGGVLFNCTAWTVWWYTGNSFPCHM